MLVTPIHGFEPGRTPPFHETLVQGGVILSYTLIDGGGRPARVRAARSQAEAAGAALAEAEQALVAGVVAAYLGVLSNRAVLEAHDRRRAALGAELERVRQRRAVGRAADVEVLRVEAALAAADAERVRLVANLDVSERDLARLIGADLGEARAERLAPVAWVDTALAAREGLTARALEASPAIARAGGAVAAAISESAIARSARWPRLDLVGAYLDRGSIEGDHRAEWNVGVQLSYPLFTGGLTSRGVERADAARRTAEERLRQAELAVAHDVDRAWSAVDESRARVASLRSAVAGFTEVARIERLRLETGVGTETDYLTAEAELLAARAGLAEAEHGAIVARVELARLTGELDPAWLQRQMEVTR
jgi:outer membrane protein